MSKFSPELIRNTIFYFDKRFKQKISPEEAEQNLSALSELYLSLLKFPPPLTPEGGGGNFSSPSSYT